jgi:hypothetical protein
VVEAGSLTKEVCQISRDVAAFLAFALLPSSDAFACLSPLLPKVFSARNFSALLVSESEPAIMPESGGDTKDLGITCCACLYECVLAVELYGRSFWIDWLFRS